MPCMSIHSLRPACTTVWLSAFHKTAWSPLCVAVSRLLQAVCSHKKRYSRQYQTLKRKPGHRHAQCYTHYNITPALNSVMTVVIPGSDMLRHNLVLMLIIESISMWLQTQNTARARWHSSREICLRLWKDVWNMLNSMCGNQFLELFPQKMHCFKPYLVFSQSFNAFIT